jgi:hypothetical protein
MPQAWKIAPGKHADHWTMCRERGCILLGWRALRDYRAFNNQKEIVNALSGEPGDGAGAARSIWRFANEIKPLDIVVANRGRARIVGIGIVKSDYLPPNSPENPSVSERLPHARLVDWVIDEPVDLEPLFFSPPTVHLLSAERLDQIGQAYVTKYPKLKNTLNSLIASISLDENDDSETRDQWTSVELQLTADGAFDPTGLEDARIRILSAIVRRQGQPAFRRRLLTAYDRRCAMTGCAVECVLEAAHIVPYKGEITNHPGNGILLRADFHTLFDLRLIAIDEATMRLLVSPKLNGTGYENYRGKKIRVPKAAGNRPSRDAIAQHRNESGLG